MKNILKHVIICCCLVLFLCSCSGTDTAGSNDSAGESIKLENPQESLTQFYTQDLAVSESEITEFYEGIEECDSIDSLLTAREENIAQMNEVIPSHELFPQLEQSMSDQQGVQLQGHSEDDNNILTVTYYVTGDQQATYAAQWGKSVNIEEDLQACCDNLKLYLGFDVTVKDLQNIKNKLLSLAKDGEYAIIVSDEIGANGINLAVIDVGTDKETWQIYASRTVTLSEEESTGNEGEISEEELGNPEDATPAVEEPNEEGVADE